MSIGLSSFGNITTLIKNFIDSNENEPFLKHISKLVNDLTNLLIESDFYDVEIKVGVDQNDVKIFKAHSNILKARSLYFKAALSTNWNKRSDNGIILFEKDNISPKVFEVLLIYIYNGIINTDNLDFYEIVELLVACDELNFYELLDDIQNCLIKKEEEWIQQDLNYLYQISSKHQSFSLFRIYFKKIISEEPGLFLKSNDFKDIEKSLLMTLLEKEHLDLKEIDVWDHVIQWGIGQIKNLEGEMKIISELNGNDFKELKNIIEDIIPLIRFQDISKVEFSNKINPYQKLFPELFWNNLLLLQSYLFPDVQQTLILLPSRIPKIISTIINQELTLLFASWIDSKNLPYNSYREVKYKLKLLYRSSRDCLDPAVFHQKCDDINGTLVVAKIQNSDQIIGGYNPCNWNGDENGIFKRSTKSFIFNISNRNDIKTAQFSYIINNDYNHAIWCCNDNLPAFGDGYDIYFDEDSVGSYPVTYNNIDIDDNSNYDELEVFQIIDKD